MAPHQTLATASPNISPSLVCEVTAAQRPDLRQEARYRSSVRRDRGGGARRGCPYARPPIDEEMSRTVSCTIRDSFWRTQKNEGPRAGQWARKATAVPTATRMLIRMTRPMSFTVFSGAPVSWAVVGVRLLDAEDVDEHRGVEQGVGRDGMVCPDVAPGVGTANGDECLEHARSGVEQHQVQYRQKRVGG
jgi:hypothetical protein